MVDYLELYLVIEMAALLAPHWAAKSAALREKTQADEMAVWKDDERAGH